MNASETFENDFLKLLFQNVGIPNIGDAAGVPPSATAGNFYLRLYTNAVALDDTTLGTECSYTGYVAKGVAIPRTTAAWSVIANTVTNLVEVLFGDCSAMPETVAYMAIWKDNVGETIADRIAWVALDSPIDVIVGSTPRFQPGSIIFTFD